MFLKKIASITAVLLVVSSPSQVQAQTPDLENCLGVNILEVATGTTFDTFIRTDSLACGNQGRVCIAAENGIDQTTSNRLYAAGLTAQASGSPVSMTIDNSLRGCNANMPTVLNLRVLN